MPRVSLLVAALLVVTSALGALPLLRGHGPLLWRAGVAVVVVLGCAAATALPAGMIFEPLAAQGAGQAPLVVVRAALTCGGLLLVPLAPHRRQPVLAAFTGAALVASWAAQAALAILALAWTLTAMNARRLAPTQARSVRSPSPPAIAIGVLALGALVSAGRALRPVAAPGPRSDEEAALHWEERDNPWRALPHARAWAASEGSPAAGLLCLARTALRLGDVEEGRVMLVEVARASRDPDARAEAARLLTALDTGAP